MGIVITLPAQNESSPFHAVVAKDGSGNYNTIQAAINAMPEGLNSPWLIFVKNGAYREQIIIPETKTFIHLIGQDKDRTIIHHRLNVGGKPEEGQDSGKTAYWKYSIHNPESEVYKIEGSVMLIKGNNFYSENISYINDWGVDTQRGPQALALKTQADCVAFNNCVFRSFQDTWMTSPRNDAFRHYAKDCWIEGAVDYIYGGGDVLLENCTLYNMRSGSVIVAPSHKTAKFGYVFRDCIVDGNKEAADGKAKLGRPWHHSPVAVYIHTNMRIPIAPEGWTNMGTIPALFAEYDSCDAEGKILDLSKRKTEYQGRGDYPPSGSCRATITKEEADNYVYENIIPGNDGWNPRKMMEKPIAPNKLKKQNQMLHWENVPGAIGYIVLNGQDVIALTKNTECALPPITEKELKVCAVGQYGTLGDFAFLAN